MVVNPPGAVKQPKHLSHHQALHESVGPFSCDHQQRKSTMDYATMFEVFHFLMKAGIVALVAILIW